MIIRALLEELKIPYDCKQEKKDVKSLGLVASDVDWDYCTFLDDNRYLRDLSEYAKVVITTRELSVMIQNLDKCVIVVEQPRLCFFRLHNMLKTNPQYIREEFRTQIGNNCKISETAVIADTNVVIGNDVIIEDFVVIKENTIIKDKCVIRSGTIVGGEGFEYKRTADNYVLPVQHQGGVILERGVSVHQNSCIDKAIYPWDNTIIGEYTKIDNLVHIAHAVKLGKSVFVIAGACLAGRVKVGNKVRIGIGAIIKNGICIGDNAQISMGAVVSKNVHEGERVTGNLAINHKTFMNFIKKLALGNGIE